MFSYLLKISTALIKFIHFYQFRIAMFAAAGED